MYARDQKMRSLQANCVYNSNNLIFISKFVDGLTEAMTHHTSKIMRLTEIRCIAFFHFPHLTSSPSSHLRRKTFRIIFLLWFEISRFLPHSYTLAFVINPTEMARLQISRIVILNYLKSIFFGECALYFPFVS